MKVPVLSCLLLLGSLAAFAQPVDSLWSRLYGGTGSEVCNSVKQTLDGGFVLCGMTNFSPTDVDAWMVKTNPSGDIEWTRTSGGVSYESAYDVVQRAGGTGYAMAGHTQSYGTGDFDIYIVRVSNSGAWQGHSHFGGTGSDHCSSIQETSDGGYILGCYTESSGAGMMDFWLVKIDSAGNYNWAHTYGGTGWDVCYSAQQTPDGGYIIAGKTPSFGAGSDDMWLVKTNSSGQTQWSRTYGGTESDWCNALVQSADGGFVLAGSTQSFGSGSADFYLVKTDANGTMQWSRWYGGANIDICWSVQRTSDGGYILAGKTLSWGAGNADMWLLKVSSTGDSLWSRTFGGSGNEECWSVQQTSDGGFILGGSTQSFGAVGYDMWLVKTGPDLAVEPDWQIIPTAYALYPNYPNPFNANTRISYSVLRQSNVSLKVFDIGGREVRTLADGMQVPGVHTILFDGSDLASGAYFVRLQSAAFAATQKMMLLK